MIRFADSHFYIGTIGTSADPLGNGDGITLVQESELVTEEQHAVDVEREAGNPRLEVDRIFGLFPRRCRRGRLMSIFIQPRHQLLQLLRNRILQVRDGLLRKCHRKPLPLVTVNPAILTVGDIQVRADIRLVEVVLGGGGAVSVDILDRLLAGH